MKNLISRSFSIMTLSVSILASTFNIVDAKIADFDIDEVKSFAQLSSIAYDGKEGITKLQAMTDQLGNKKYSQVKHFGSKAEYDSGILLIAPDGKVTINYRGTDFGSIRNLATDVYALQKGTRISEGLVHGGIYDGLKSSWDDLYSQLFAYAKSRNKTVGELEIDITGHSLGGGMATLAALRLKKMSGADKLRVITFGQPRVLDTTAAEEYERLLGGKTLRVTEHQVDPVPSLALGALGFKHVGQNLRLEHADVSLTKAAKFGYHRMSSYENSLQSLNDTNFVANNEESAYLKSPMGYVRNGLTRPFQKHVYSNLVKAATLIKQKLFGKDKYVEEILK